jgi:phage terminase small subunit
MTTPPQTPSELDKAVEEEFLKCVKLCAEELLKNPDDAFVIKAISESFEPFLLAAKHLKEVEKERDRWSELCHQLGHGEMSVQSFYDTKQEISTIRTEYNNVVEKLQLILPMAKGYAHNNQVGNNLKFIDEANELLSTPHAIAAMKKGEV